MDRTKTPSLAAVGLELRRSDSGSCPAVITPDCEITFEELHERVAQFATTIARDSPPSDWLPVFVDRSLDTLIALQAVLRAGRAFVPIETTLPPERIAELIELCGSPPSAVVPRMDLRAIVPRHMSIVEPGTLHTTVVQPVPVAPDEPAWLCFTSGSTGVPKGVYGSWEHIDRTILKFEHQVPDTSNRLALVWPLSFLAGIYWVWRLSNGTCVCLIDPTNRSVDEVVSWSARAQITLANFGGALGASIAQATHLQIPSIREFFIGQTGADWSWVDRIRQLTSPNVTIVNNLDSSEAGFGSSYRVEPDDEILSGPIPVGRLGESPRLRLEPCEEGLEIWFRDPCSIGYYNMPELTAEKYVTDTDGTRWWRSGDLATVDDRGLIYFAGRVDLMVKINGIRVEPAESEAALRSIPGVSMAAVIAHPVGDGNVRLVGHVCIDDEDLTPESVRSQLARRLPAHLIPSVFMRHASFPSTERGKVDRGALAEIPVVRWRTRPFVKTGHPIAIWLRHEFEKVIDLGPVGTHDDIWESGLDSMGAIEICARISAHGIGDIDPTVLLRHRTAEQLARLFETGQPLSKSPVVLFNAEGSRTPLIVVPGNGGTSLAFRSLATAVGEDQPLLIVEPRGMHSIGRIERTVDERVATLLGEINSRLKPDEPCILLGYSLGGTIAFAAAKALQECGRTVHLVLLDGTLSGRNHSLGKNPHDRTSQIRHRSRVTRLRRTARQSFARLSLPFKVRVMHLYKSRPHYSSFHYKMFMAVGATAIKKYDLTPTPIPTTLFHTTNSILTTTVTQIVGRVDSHEVGGDHFSMLHEPHIVPIAKEILRLRDSIAGTTSPAMHS